jgi:hypothetical protein
MNALFAGMHAVHEAHRARAAHLMRRALAATVVGLVVFRPSP